MFSEIHSLEDDVFRVVVVDDHEMILESIIRLLAADSRINVVGTALTATEGIETVRDVAPDVLIIDYHLPDMDAPEAITTIKLFDPQVRIITMSGSDRPEEQLASIRAGSTAWIRKTRAIQELIDAIVVLPEQISEQLVQQPTLDQLVVHYQPVMRIDTDQIIGIEALVRWEHPERGLLLPEAFLPRAIETGFIESIDVWVRDQAFQQMVTWQSLFPSVPRIWISVNLPGNAVTNPRFMNLLKGSISSTGIDPKDVMVEIPESVLLDDPDSTFEFLTMLNGIGVRLALENFGSSFSPIAYIHRVPIDCLKIDRSFTAELPDSMGTYWLIECIAKFAGSMGMMCIVEGVERFSQIASIQSMGLNVGQGSFLSPPMNAKDCEVFMGKALQNTITSTRTDSAFARHTGGAST
jgi:EAL domain-containing protein (putative c-di-GMP-specific phosphodiesterase class I)/CheY-like chemotaxis protein